MAWKEQLQDKSVYGRFPGEEKGEHQNTEQLQDKPIYVRDPEEEQEFQDKPVQTTDLDEEEEEEEGEEWTKERKQHIDESISFLKQQLVGLPTPYTNSTNPNRRRNPQPPPPKKKKLTSV